MNASIARLLPSIVPLPTAVRAPDRRSRSYRPDPRQRFKLLPFVNGRTGSQSWRVAGIKRDGTRIRENFSDPKAAHCRLIELEGEFLGRAEEDTALRATRMTDTQIKVAEAVFPRLERDDELLSAVDFWIRVGRQQAVKESVRLDEAVEQFKAWVDATESLRPRTKSNLKLRVSIFGNSVGNVIVSTITPEFVESYLDKRSVAAASRDNDRRVVSRFFAWCIQRPRRWLASNPAREVRVEQGEKSPPAVLTVSDCEKLLRAAESLKEGRLAPYMAVCLFGGLRPFEAARLLWEQVNLADGEIRLEGPQTKTGRPRVVTIGPTLKAWLKTHQGKPFSPPNWRKDFDAIKRAAGFSGRQSTDANGLKPWEADVLRHTAISHCFRESGSYGLTAEWAGNSESIIKRFYQARVSTEDTKKFYALKPKATR